MNYGKFMRQLAAGIEDKIVAYDGNTAERCCMIYLSKRDHTIMVPDTLIEWRREDAKRVLRQHISGNMLTAPVMRLTDRDGVLTLVPVKAMSMAAE